MVKPAAQAGRPILAADVIERFVEPARTAGNKSSLVYRPMLLGNASCHYVKSGADVDVWIDSSWLACQGGEVEDDVWENATKLTGKPWELSKEPAEGVTYEELPDALLAGRNYKKWQTQLKDFLYRHEPVRVFECPDLKCFSQPNQDELDARLGLEQKMREIRDAEKDKLRDKYDAIVKGLESKIMAAQQRVEKEGSQFMGQCHRYHRWYGARHAIGQQAIAYYFNGPRIRQSRRSAHGIAKRKRGIGSAHVGAVRSAGESRS